MCVCLHRTLSVLCWHIYLAGRAHMRTVLSWQVRACSPNLCAWHIYTYGFPRTPASARTPAHRSVRLRMSARARIQKPDLEPRSIRAKLDGHVQHARTREQYAYAGARSRSTRLAGGQQRGAAMKFDDDCFGVARTPETTTTTSGWDVFRTLLRLVRS